MQTTSERIDIAVGDASMPGYFAKPVGEGRWPGVLLFMEIFGVNEHVRSVADRVAGEGYVVVAPDLFHRTAPGIELGYDDAGLQRGIELMGRTKASELIADAGAALDALKGRRETGGRGVGAMGFCFGGHVAYLAACELPIAATASFYGGGIAVSAPGDEKPTTVERTGKITGKILCLFGDQDTYIPAAEVETIKAALEKHGVRHEVVVYPGVGHGFFCDVRDSYDRSSADDAWSKVRQLFKDELP